MQKLLSNRRLASAFLAVVVLLVCASIFFMNAKVNGDIFVVTRSSENLKLGLVQVQVFDEDSFRGHIKEHQEKVESKQAPEVQKLWNDFLKNWKKAVEVNAENARLKGKSPDAEIAAIHKEREAFIERLTMAEVKTYFHDLPPPFTSTKTDANGEFAVTLPRTGRFVLVAIANRDLGIKTEEYYWAIKVSSGWKSARRVSLNNDNLVTSDSPESAVRLILPALMK